MADPRSKYWINERPRNKFSRAKSKRASSLDMRNPALLEYPFRRSATPSEEKILNIDGISDVRDRFLEVCDTFEKTLRGLNLKECTSWAYERLTKIVGLIEEKLSLVKISESSEKSFGALLRSANSSMSDLSLSGICFENSSDLDMVSNSFLEEFMTSVNCPFCSEIQTDKISFVKHLDNSCSPHHNKKFKKGFNFPYAAFQILPNNTFKCNICPNAVQRDLKSFCVHIQSEFHVQNYAKASRARNYEKRLFCSCCKTLVHNNQTQISSHINHEAHKNQCVNKKTSKYFLLKGIRCVFNESKKFKCLDCPSATAVSNTPRDALDHFEDPNHKKHMKKNVPHSSQIYCEICSEEVHMYKIISHFNSSQHSAAEKKLKDRSFEMCFCCDFFCETLIELSFHMESDCDGIHKIRQKISGESQPKKEAKIEGNVPKGPRITVKNCTEIPELYKYFKKFGEIVTIESHTDKDVIIEFREKSTVNDILLLQDVIVVGGIKLDITTNFKPDKSNDNVHETDSEGGNSENEASDSSSKSDGGGDGDNAVMIENDELDELFGRVSAHLMNTAQNLNSTEEGKIQRDCNRTLRTEVCHLVGFSGSGLSFPSESINLFCGIEGDIFLSTINACFAPLNESDNFTANLLEASYKRLCDSELWQKVESCTTQGPYSYLRCTHKETQRACTITFTKSALVLTDMLRECMEKSNLVQPFCMIIRFWLSVHELKIQTFEFALISLLVFFLISVKVVTLSEAKYKSYGVRSFFTAGEIEAFRPSSQSVKPFANVKELFQEFLNFIHTFNFDKYAIYLPLPRLIPKTVLYQTKFKLLLPKNLLSTKNCSMCILDPISSVNLAADIQGEDRHTFLKIVSATVRHYKLK